MTKTHSIHDPARMEQKSTGGKCGCGDVRTHPVFVKDTGG